MPYLIIQFEAGRVQQVELAKSPTVIGRGPSCNVQIIDPKISRHHCRLVERDGQWHLVDIPSRNHTWIGDEVVKQVRLREGDQFRIGRTLVTFCTEVDPTKVIEEPPDGS